MFAVHTVSSGMIEESYFINSQMGRIGRDLGMGVKLPFTNSSSFTHKVDYKPTGSRP